MAIPSWLQVTPLSGELNGTVSVTADPHTGRTQRSYNGSIQGQGVVGASTSNITQPPKAEFVTFDNASVSAPKDGGEITVTGKTNSSKLTFSMLGGGGIDIPIPAKYKASGLDTDNGAAIAGDPGQNNEFAFSIVLTIPVNTTVDELTSTLKVVANSVSITAQVNIVQTAGNAFLWINTVNNTTVSLTIPQTGTPAQTFNVLSNVPWTVS